eukprot:2682954-Amphidinium_carterae.1
MRAKFPSSCTAAASRGHTCKASELLQYKTLMFLSIRYFASCGGAEKKSVLSASVPAVATAAKYRSQQPSTSGLR